MPGNTPTTNAFTNNQLPGVSYDASGNQSVVNGNSVTYDAENHQVSVTAPAAMGGGVENYFYDGAGQRVQKSGPGGVVNYVYDAFGILSAEYDSAVAQPAPCQTCYLSTDHLGNLRLVTDQVGNIVSRHDYLPYGEETTVGRNAQWNANDTLSQKFTGQMRDPETGEDYFNARMFGSALGRFTSPDPRNAGADLMNPQSWNAYSYVMNNPLNGTDSTGMYRDLWSGDGPPCFMCGGSGGGISYGGANNNELSGDTSGGQGSSFIRSPSGLGSNYAQQEARQQAINSGLPDPEFPNRSKQTGETIWVHCGGSLGDFDCALYAQSQHLLASGWQPYFSNSIGALFRGNKQLWSNTAAVGNGLGVATGAAVALPYVVAMVRPLPLRQE